jgi:hypothetical protein
MPAARARGVVALKGVPVGQLRLLPCDARRGAGATSWACTCRYPSSIDLHGLYQLREVVGGARITAGRAATLGFRIDFAGCAAQGACGSGQSQVNTTTMAQVHRFGRRLAQF